MGVVGYMHKPVLGVTYKVTLNGKVLNEEELSYIENIQINKTVFGAMNCTLDIIDPHFRFMDDNMWLADNPISIELKSSKVVRGDYATTDNTVTSVLVNPNKTKFEGVISMVDCSFPSDGVPMLSITCMDKTHLMNRKPKTRIWHDKKISDVVKAILGEYGFKPTVDDTEKVYTSIEQKDLTDIVFIEELINEIETDQFLFYLEGEKAYFIRKKVVPCNYHLAYRQAPYSLHSFSPRINKERVQENPKKEDIDLESMSTVDETIDPNVPLNGGEEVKNSISKSGSGDSKGKEFYVLTGKVDCEPHFDMNVGEGVKLFGLGKVLSGDYFIEEISYSISSQGMKQSLSVSKTAFGG